MKRRRHQFDEAKNARYIRQGRGAGQGKDYAPWLQVRDVPSHGRRHRMFGTKTQRIHHFMSDVERNVDVGFQEAADVLDVKEQTPLNREETYRIACEMGVKHPLNRDGHEYIMTTDFLVTFATPHGPMQKAYSVKYGPVKGKRTLEKLEIERRYWESKGIPWKIVTRDDLDMRFITNVLALRSFFSLEGTPEPYDGCFQEIQVYITSHFLPVSDQRLADWCDELDNLFGIPADNALVVAKHLLARKLLITDLWDAAQVELRPLSAFSLSPAVGR